MTSAGRLGVTAAKLATHLDVTRQRIPQLVAEGVLVRLQDGGFDEDACRTAYIRWLRDEGRRSSRTASRVRVDDARARSIEIRNAERERTTISIDDGIAAIDFFLGPLIADLSSVGPRVTDDLAFRQRIDDEHDRVCNALADRATRACQAMTDGRDPFDDEGHARPPRAKPRKPGRRP